MLCPLKYRNNCRAYPDSCPGCRVEGEVELPLLYNPIVDIGPHPNVKQVRREANREAARARRGRSSSLQSHNARRGRKVERAVLQELGAKSTPGSGAVLGDGDGHLMLGDGLHYIEHKSRVKGSPGPTSGEWAKAVTQGCDIFIVSSPAGVLVTIPLELFKELIT